MRWTLASAEARADAHASFKIPSRADREALRVGDLAKLIFVDPDAPADGSGARGERMWVEIVSVREGGYLGRLRNSPVLIDDLEADAMIDFGPEHVADCDQEAR